MHGKACAELTVAAYDNKKQKQRWPAMCLLGKNLPVTNWGEYAYIVFEANNTTNHVVPLRVAIMGQNRCVMPANVPPGRHTIRRKILDSAKCEPVSQINLDFDRPIRNYSVYIDNLRLESEDSANELSKLKHQFNSLRNKINASTHHPTQLDNDMLAVETQIELLSKKLDNLKRGDSVSKKSLAKWYKESVQLATKLNDINKKVVGNIFDEQKLNPVLSYGWTDGLEKVMRDNYVFKGEVGGKIEIEVAANEYEGAQLVLRASRPISNISVTVSDLLSENGTKISRNNIEILPVGYVKTKQPPYYVSRTGWWPDPLLNYLSKLNLEADVLQPVWIDVYSMPNQIAGSYKGIVTVKADGIPSLKVPLEVTVWDFAVPEEHHFPTAVSFDEKHLKNMYSKNPKQWEKFEKYSRGEINAKDLGAGEARRLCKIRRKCQDMLLEHRITPDDIYRNDPPRVDDIKRWVKHGVRSFNICTICDGTDRTIEKIEKLFPSLEDAGCPNMGYIYSWDETEPEAFYGIVKSYGAIKKKYPKIPLITTAHDPSLGTKSGLDKYVDVWVPGLTAFETYIEDVRAAQKRGRKVYWYTCTFPHPPAPNWFIEGSAVGTRLLFGFMPYKYKCDGFLHYGLNRWEAPPEGKNSGKHIPWPHLLQKGPLTNSDGRSHNSYNGDGYLFYPGEAGPVPSIRLKCTRDGLEDYEYLWMLSRAVEDVKRNKLQVNQDWLKQAEAALVVDSSLVKTVTNYSREGKDLLDARRQVAKLLEEYNTISKNGK